MGGSKNPFKQLSPGTKFAIIRRTVVRNAPKGGSVITGSLRDYRFWGTLAASCLLDYSTQGKGTTALGVAALPFYIDDPRFYDTLGLDILGMSEEDAKALALLLIANPSTDIVSESLREYIAGAAFAVAYEDGSLAIGNFLGDNLYEFEAEYAELLKQLLQEYGLAIPPTVANLFTASLTATSPIVLDLDGDGVETVGVDSDDAVYFDFDGDGRQQKTGWVHSDDGLLVFDRNGDRVHLN